MKNILCIASGLAFLLCNCTKDRTAENLSAASDGFTAYVIPQGQHAATGNSFKAVETDEVKFVVKFDSSAIYQTTDPANQDDINKLYGFSDNGGQHHLYSARFGWRWSKGALRLFAYTYNSGEREAKELGVVPIAEPVSCAIKVSGEQYIFSLNEKTETMPRLSTTAKAKGYRLYPYFGGDEVAPHEVRVWIREE